jgi:imidazolonepropionase-like amidohydrolase
MVRLVSRVVFLAGIMAATTALANPQIPGAPQERPVLLRGGDLYTVSHGVLPATDLLFDNGTIVGIGRNLVAPEGSEVIDVAGHRVYPGLIAAQTSIGLVEISAVRATSDVREVGDLTPEVTAHVAYNPDSEIIPTVRSHGITTVQVTPVGQLVRGQSMLVHLDGWNKEDAGVRLVDGLALNWPATRIVRGGWTPRSEEEQRKQMEEERRKLRRYFDEARAYRLATIGGAAPDSNVRLEAMIPYLDGRLPVYVSANDYRQIVEAIAFGERYGLRMVLVGGREADKAADLLRRSNIPVILGSTQALPLRQDDDYDQAYTLPSRLHAAGVRFSLSHPGSWAVRNFPFQASQAVAYGLPEEVALRAMTLSAAEILGIADRQGSLEVGKRATLFVSEGDVMDTLGQDVMQMWIEGKRVDLDNRHRQFYRKYLERLTREGSGSR